MIKHQSRYFPSILTKQPTLPLDILECVRQGREAARDAALFQEDKRGTSAASVCVSIFIQAAAALLRLEMAFNVFQSGIRNV